MRVLDDDPAFVSGSSPESEGKPSDHFLSDLKPRAWHASTARGRCAMPRFFALSRPHGRRQPGSL
jgi:hypothetical protein